MGVLSLLQWTGALGDATLRLTKILVDVPRIRVLAVHSSVALILWMVTSMWTDDNGVGHESLEWSMQRRGNLTCSRRLGLAGNRFVSTCISCRTGNTSVAFQARMDNMNKIQFRDARHNTISTLTMLAGRLTAAHIQVFQRN